MADPSTATGPLLLLVISLAGCGSDSGGTGLKPDTQPPSVPAGLSATGAPGHQIDLAWSASTDNVAVVGYDLFRDGAALTSIEGTTHTDTGLALGVQHCYRVSARDAAGNSSAASAPVCANAHPSPPSAAFTAPSVALVRTTVTFDASGSNTVDGTIVSYTFDFGDGSAPVEGALPIAQHTYAVVGNFQVTVMVATNLGEFAWAFRRIDVGLALLLTPVSVSHSNASSQSSWTSREDDGSIDIVWEESGSWVMFSRSTDGGASFSTPKSVIDPAGYWTPTNGYSPGQIKVAGAGGTIHVTYTLFDTFGGGAEVFQSRSMDHGATWSEPVFISPNDGVNSVNADLAANGDGTVALVWGDADFNTGRDAVGYSRSTDDGATFSPARTVVAPVGYAGCPAIAGSSSVTAVDWIGGDVGSLTIYSSNSTDGGQSFTTPVQLSQSTNVGPGLCPQLARSAAGIIYGVWHEGSRVFFASSANGGASFSSPKALSPPDMSGFCESIAIGSGGELYVVWSQSGNNVANSVLARSSDGGVSFETPIRIPPDVLPLRCYRVTAGTPDQLGLTWFAPPDASTNLAVVFFARLKLASP